MSEQSRTEWLEADTAPEGMDPEEAEARHRGFMEAIADTPRRIADTAPESGEGR